MSEFECPACGAKAPVPEKIDGDQLIVACPHCGAEIQISIESSPSKLGEVTLFQPHLLSKELRDAPSEGAAIEDVQKDVSARASAGTMVLESENFHLTPPNEELKVKAYLDLEGAMPGDGHFPLVNVRTVVGREGADITIHDPALSSHHFEVEARGKEFFIRDLNSSNGTKLNGDRIRAAQLSSGDRIRAGQTTFVFQTLEAIPWDRS